MNFKTLFSAIALIAGSLSALNTQAASTTEGLMLYQFESSRPVPIDTSLSLMKTYIGETPETAAPGRDQTVRFISPKDPNTRFEQNLKTGDIRFHRNFARYLGDYAPKLPSTEEAMKAAHIFLEENKLLPRDESQLNLIHVGGLRMTSTDGKEPGAIIDKLITLNYSRVINDMPVIGPGSKFVIEVGEEGEILGLTKHWREFLPEGKPISPNEMYSFDEAIKLATRQLQQEFGENVQYEFLQTKIAYFDNNGKFLQPVYAFETKVFVPSHGVEPFNYVSVIPVMINSPEKLELTKLDPRALRAIKIADESITPIRLKKSE
ncbi:hypothetical protein [Methylocucumis oryzae]|uniref:Uncharacterized protein n=1 Tax=Methylocucumis oryzae TaxID=1632867 RepID=A0A0F3IL04_9GAMM|nr:hypothetical protein [Methylocucumis oryzae]KJV07357.1 hypothetical protein VZ94_05240 [Methylocucumis oryzae]